MIAASGKQESSPVMQLPTSHMHVLYWVHACTNCMAYTETSNETISRYGICSHM